MKRKFRIGCYVLERDFYRGLAAGLPDCEITGVSSLRQFLAFISKRGPDLIIMDSAVSKISAADLVRVVKENPPTAKTLVVLAGRGEKAAEKTFLFNRGCDEILPLSCGAGFFAVRVKNLLMRKSFSGGDPRPAAALSRGLFKMNLDSREAFYKNRRLPLTSLEFDMMRYFIANAGRIATRATLINAVWRSDLRATHRGVDKRIEVLRKKLGAFGKRLRTVFGMGYMFK